VNVLYRYLKVVDDLGDQRGYEALGLFGVLCNQEEYEVIMVGETR
jgi:hypothetical protein